MGADHRRWHRIGRRDPLCLLSAILLYLINEHLLKRLTENTFIQGHFNDLLAMLLLLPYTNILLALYPHKRLGLHGWIPCVAYSLFVGVFWEYVTPLYWAKSTSDLVDLAMYLIGGLAYALYQKIGSLSPSREV